MTPADSSRTSLAHARRSLATTLPTSGMGVEKILDHLHEDIIPGLNQSSLSSRYFGFVTGGVTPAASVAERIVGAYDQNVCVHLPAESIATDVEDKALRMLCELLSFDTQQFAHRVFTTGATASNLMGLVLGREHVLKGCADEGVLGAANLHAVSAIKVLTAAPHSSLVKTAAIAGIGHSNVVDVGRADDPNRVDFDKLEEIMQESPKTGFIIGVSCSEVNTGHFATQGLAELQRLRTLCDTYNGWLHVDGAFGLFARLLDKTTYPQVTTGAAGMELADSITGDGHKLLNVPYDCGFFFSKHLPLATNTFQNPNAAYLNSGTAGAAAEDFIPSPLNIGIENSRRFRALPVYASLLAYGREGYAEMLSRQIELTRKIAGFVMQHPAYILLPELDAKARGERDILDGIFMILLFRAVDTGLNRELKQRINATGKIYVSPTKWKGEDAVRMAVANWRVRPVEDFNIVKEVLEAVAEEK